jgi:VanZ family protein
LPRPTADPAVARITPSLLPKLALSNFAIYNFLVIPLQKYKIILTFAPKLKVKMEKLLQYTRKYPISVGCIALIWVLSLAPFFPETPLDDVAFIDKWVHVVMYGGTFTILWIEYSRNHLSADYEKLVFWAWLAPVAMSGAIELIQAYCTGGRRSGEWLDFAANGTGVTLAAAIGLLILAFRPRS